MDSGRDKQSNVGHARRAEQQGPRNWAMDIGPTLRTSHPALSVDGCYSTVAVSNTQAFSAKLARSDAAAVASASFLHATV